MCSSFSIVLIYSPFLSLAVPLVQRCQNGYHSCTVMAPGGLLPPDSKESTRPHNRASQVGASYFASADMRILVLGFAI